MQVDWERRVPVGCFVALADVTRVQIPMPTVDPWDYFSVKDGFYALKWEIAITVQPPYECVWVNGPYRGAKSDITIFNRHRLTHVLEPGEMVMADKGYVGSSKCGTPFKGYLQNLNADQRRINKKNRRIRQAIERFNKRLKDFDCLSGTWKYGANLCELVVMVACQILNFTFHDEPL